MSVWKIKLWFSKVSTQNLRHYNVQQQKHTAVHFSADRLNRAEGEWLGRVQSVFIVGPSRWPQQYKFRSRCKYSVCSSLKKVPVNMLSSRANRQVLRACRLAISPFLRRNIQTSKPRSTFAKDLFLGRFNKVRKVKNLIVCFLLSYLWGLWVLYWFNFEMQKIVWKNNERL